MSVKMNKMSRHVHVSYLEYELSKVITYIPSVIAEWLPMIGEM
jgi:hypothetical protein